MIGSTLLSAPAAAQASNAPRVSKTPSVAVPTKDVKFEVASVRPAGPNSGQWAAFGIKPDGITSKLSVAQMIMAAYAPYGTTFHFNGRGMTRLLSVGPQWIDEPYVVNARVSDADRDAWRDQGIHQDLFKAALRNLLKDRFRLVLHEEPTMVDGFQLVIANKKGPTFKASIPGAVLPTTRAVSQLSGGVSVGTREGRTSSWSFYASTMEDLARFLTGSSDAPVVDMTGLHGYYDFTLRSVQSSNPGDGGESENNWPVDPLGLALKPGKIQVLGLVIDHIEKPTPN